jgi:tyrosyl-tRNA synthetase
MSDILSDLQWRGLLADCTDLDGLRKRLATGQPLTVYCGFDPTGDSLHVGHLMGQLTLARFQRAGHHVIALAGGATGMVGDPSGRSSERNLLTREQLAHNIACIKGQLSHLLDFTAASNPARLVDNADWIAPFSFLEFLRDVGKHFSLNVMLAKDSVKSRMEGDSGISYTEFSYQLLQAYDFFHLKKTFNCELQIGGSDQWGNLTAGTDLIRKKLGHDATAWGWTFPLITKSDGTKFGKTASGAVWLDPQKTSPYRLYQFFVNTEDAKVCEYLRKFTFLTREQIEPLEAAHAANPGAREAHKTLAREVTILVHGERAWFQAAQASAVLFLTDLHNVDIEPELFAEVMGELPGKDLERAKLDGAGAAIIDLVVQAGLEPSKGAARKSLEAGGVYLNNVRADLTRTVTAADLLFGKYLLLRKGKKSYAVLTAK